jgi:hypothetical protein
MLTVLPLEHELDTQPEVPLVEQAAQRVNGGDLHEAA